MTPSPFPLPHPLSSILPPPSSRTVSHFVSSEFVPESEADEPPSLPEAGGLRDFFVGAATKAGEGTMEWAPDFCKRALRKRPNLERERLARPRSVIGESQDQAQDEDAQHESHPCTRAPAEMPGRAFWAGQERFFPARRERFKGHKQQRSAAARSSTRMKDKKRRGKKRMNRQGG